MITMNTKPPIPPNSSFYPPNLLNFPRIPLPTNSMSNESMFTSNSAFMPAQAYVQTDHNSAFYPAANVIVSNPSANQQALPWRNFPGWTFDQLSVYPYGTGYSSLDVRRKNATRESTSTLKAWLYEHIKNPYPTKAEKIMLAIITKMTLTQVSTWFANARRRLKKENKMQWSPRNRTGDDEDDDDDKNSDNDESDISRHRAMDDDLLDDEGDIIVDGVADETPENIAMSNQSNLTKPPYEASGEISKDGHQNRDAAFKSSIPINNALHQKSHQQNAHPHLYFNPQNQNRHISFPSFHPSLRNFSSLQQSFNFINKSFMPRFKSSDEDKESTNHLNVSHSSGKVISEVRASTPKRIQSNEVPKEVDKKVTKPRIWCLADVATSNNKDKENNNNGNSNPDSNEFKNHSMNAMRQANIHQALVQFYHPYFSHINPLRIGDKSYPQRSETYDGMANGGTSNRRSPETISEEKSGNTFQPWLTLNERFNQERFNQERFNQERVNHDNINHKNSPPILRKLTTRSPDSRNTTPHSSPDVMRTFKSRYSRDVKVSHDVPSEASKSSFSNSSSPASNLACRRRSPSLSPPKKITIISPPPPSSSSSSSSSSLSSILSSTTKSMSSSLLFQTQAHLPLSSDVIISAPQSPLAYRKHSPSRDSTFEYWPAGRVVDK